MQKNKKTLAVILTTIISLISNLVISMPVQAATGDIYNIGVGANLTTPVFTKADTAKISNQKKIILGADNYGYEANGKVFKFNDFAKEFSKLGYSGAIASISKDMDSVGTVTLVSSLTVSSVSAINTTKNIGDLYTLPATITVTLSDRTTKNLAVTWNNVASTGVAGTYTFTGTLTMVYGVVNPNNIIVTATLTVETDEFSINYSWSNGTVAPQDYHYGNIKIDSNLNCELNYWSIGGTLNKKFSISEEQKNTLYKLMLDNHFDTKEWKSLGEIPGGGAPISLSGILNDKKFSIPAYLSNNDSEIVSPVYKFIYDLVNANL